MPTENHRLRRHAPPQFMSRSQRNLLLFFLKCIIMVIVMSLFLFFIGFAAIVLLHFLFMSKTFHRRCTRLLHPTAVAAVPDIQALIPQIKFRATDFPGKLDCAICLDSFQEGDNCRNIPICKHLFHAKCVDRWIGKKPTCPVCRTQVDLDPSGLQSSRIKGDDQWKRLWSVNLDEGTSY